MSIAALRTISILLIAPILLAGALQQPSDPQKTWALVIGISNYAYAEPLQYAATDGMSFLDFLESPRGGAIPHDHIFALIEDQATRTGVMVALEALQDKVHAGDSVYVYIAGHGYVKNRVGYFIPSDGVLTSPAASAVSFSHLKDMVESGLAQSKVRILITDMCNAGRIGPDRSALGEKIQNLINDELMRINAGSGSFLNLLASRPTEPSWERDDLGKGVFTHTLLEALNGKAVQTGSTVASAKDVVNYVRNEVPKFTANQQNPMANEGFDPNLPLAFLNQPGPTTKTDADRTTLLLQNVNRTAFARVEWQDPRTQSKAVRQLPKDRERVQIGFLNPGGLELQLFDKDNKSRAIGVKLERGQNSLDLGSATFRFTPAGPVRVASLGGAAAPEPQQNIADTESSLAVRLDGNTEIYLDDAFFGRSTPVQPLVKLTGLTPGVHIVRLVPTPDREYRFRVKLFPGEHFFDLTTGELRFVLEPRPPSRTPAPAGMPSALDATFQAFSQALWEERLVQPAGNSAWDFYQQLRDRVPANVRSELEDRLAVAMGDRAQRTILKYLRGGDIRWNAAVFDEGNDLLNRVEQFVKVLPALESQKFFFQGRALVERGQYPQAVARLQQAVNLDSQASHALNAIGLSYWKQNQLDQAVAPLQQAIALTPEWNYPRVTLSLVYLEQRRYDDADRSFREAIQTNSEDSTAYHGLAQLQFLRGQYTDAQTQLDRALEFNPGNAYAYETFGKLRQRTGQLNEAERLFRLAIRLEPDEPSFQVSLAGLLKQIGQIPDAQNIFAAAANRNPANLQVVQGYTTFLAERNQPAQAQAVFDRALKASPNEGNLHLLYGGFLMKQNKARDAEREYRTAIKLNARNTFAHHDLAVLYLSQKKLKDAEQELTAAVEADTRFAGPHRTLAQIRSAQGRRSDAVSEYQKALSLAVEPEQRQEINDAIAELERSETRDAVGNARASASSGNYKDAWTRYIAALKTSPNDSAARNALVELFEGHPADLDPKSIPVPAIADVLRTSFWKSRQDAERLWQRGDKAAAINAALSAVQVLTDNERRIIGSTAFNLQNDQFSIHQIVFVWAQRMIDERNYQGAQRLTDAALDKKIFGVVPNFTPKTIDSLMTAADMPDPKVFSDFEVAFHPDRRAHSIFAALSAAGGDIPGALAYLAPLKATSPNDAIGILKNVLPTPAAFVSMGDTQCAAGDCAAGRATIEAGLQRFPNDAQLREALGRMR